jgi:cellobiose-specific phosphotransferase system component IIC
MPIIDPVQKAAFVLICQFVMFGGGFLFALGRFNRDIQAIGEAGSNVYLVAAGIFVLGIVNLVTVFYANQRKLDRLSPGLIVVQSFVMIAFIGIVVLLKILKDRILDSSDGACWKYEDWSDGLDEKNHCILFWGSWNLLMIFTCIETFLAFLGIVLIIPNHFDMVHRLESEKRISLGIGRL